MKNLLWSVPAIGLLLLSSSCQKLSEEGEEGEAPDPAEVAAGERLFLETRFAQFFSQNCGGDVNAVLSSGDPALDDTVTVTGALRGPFKGKSMNCRACHLVDEHAASPLGGVRAYADFARRSPIPDRGDGRTLTPRNSPTLVDSTVPRSAPLFLHFDGEFATLEDLARGTFTGRNFGWLPAEQSQAVAHLAAVIRGDNGSGDLAAQFGGLSYAVLLDGTNPGIPPELVIPSAFRIDASTATDQQIFDAVAALVAAYVDSLRFARSPVDAFSGSPYDVFLAKNGLPVRPDAGETDLDYGRRLRGLLAGLAAPVFVTPTDGSFTLHAQDFRFGPREFEGLKVFLAEPSSIPPSGSELAAGKIGSCISCHAPPNFSDFKFHNIGAAQNEYDAIHGTGQFAALVGALPTLASRTDADLPPTGSNPSGTGRFLDVPRASAPGRTDLGLWNVFANPHVPGPQAALASLLGASSPPSNADLAGTVARFKTPSLRDLGQSAPYFHTGQKDSTEDVIRHYLAFSVLARAGQVPNAAPELSGIAVLDADVDALRAFLRSLNEDYQ
ncbi:MAG: hypothetical protein JO332_11050 [Planctomycetaceae bacterium]|nr:hypothetical protein [Planctomycetaceae bacterium]